MEKTYDKEKFVNSMNNVRTLIVGKLANKIARAKLIKEVKRLVNEEGKTMSEAAKELDIAESNARALIQEDDETITINIHDAHWILTALIHHFDSEKGFKGDKEENK